MMMRRIFAQRAHDVRACLFYLTCRGHLVDGTGLCYFCRDLAETVIFDPVVLWAQAFLGSHENAIHSVCCECARRLVAVGWRSEDNLEGERRLELDYFM